MLGAYAAWRRSAAATAVIALVTLVLSYLTGFSIGLFYFPGAAALTLSAILLVVARRTQRPTTKAQ